MRAALTDNRGKQVLDNARRAGGSRYFNDKGDLNASSNRDALMVIAEVFEKMSRGELITANDDSVLQKRQQRQELYADLLEAFHDKNSDRWSEMGAGMANQLSLTAEREGFMRRILVRIDIPANGIPRVPIRKRDGIAFKATGPSQIQQMFNRENNIILNEFYIRARVFVETREIVQSTADIVDTKYLEAQEAIMVVEDNTWKALADGAVGIANPLVIMAGGFNPVFLTTLTSSVTQYGFMPNVMLASAQVIADLQAQETFSNFFDPISKLELIQTGMLGTILGLTIITDSYRDPLLRVLLPGELYVVATGDVHGAYTDRGPVTSTPFDGQQLESGIPGRGWNMNELMSMIVHNPESLAKGIRA